MMMMMPLNCVFIVFLIINAVSCMSWSMIYSSLAVGLCRNSQFQTGLRESTSEIGVEATYRVQSVCKILNTFETHEITDASRIMEALERVDNYYGTFVEKTNLNFDKNRRHYKGITLKRAFRYFVAGLPENISTGLFQIGKWRYLEMLKPLVLSCFDDLTYLVHEKDAKLSPFLVSYCPLNQGVSGKPTMPLRTDVSLPKTPGATYVLDMVFTQIESSLGSFMPVTDSDGNVTWKSVCTSRGIMGGAQLNSEIFDNEAFTSLIADQEALYIYRKDNSGRQSESARLLQFQQQQQPQSVFSLSNQLLVGGLSTMRGYLENWRPSPLNILLGATSVGLMIGGITFSSELHHLITQAITSSPHMTHLLSLSTADFITLLRSQASALSDLVLELLHIIRSNIPDISLSSLLAIGQMLQEYIFGA